MLFVQVRKKTCGVGGPGGGVYAGNGEEVEKSKTFSRFSLLTCRTLMLQSRRRAEEADFGKTLSTISCEKEH